MILSTEFILQSFCCNGAIVLLWRIVLSPRPLDCNAHPNTPSIEGFSYHYQSHTLLKAISNLLDGLQYFAETNNSQGSHSPRIRLKNTSEKSGQKRLNTSRSTQPGTHWDWIFEHFATLQDITLFLK
jgi:hypothetical protein